jgi:hypothetical protein
MWREKESWLKKHKTSHQAHNHRERTSEFLLAQAGQVFLNPCRHFRAWHPLPNYLKPVVARNGSCKRGAEQ